MRHKIVSPNQKAYDAIKSALADRIRVDLPRRLMLSVEGLTLDDQKLVVRHGPVSTLSSNTTSTPSQLRLVLSGRRFTSNERKPLN
jgi:hypothetical protein